MKQGDKIRIENLEVFAYHGVYPEETKEGQNFYVNAVLYTDTRKAGTTDQLECSTNYGEVCHFIHTYMTEHTWKLIESVAEQTAEAVLLAFPLVQSVKLEIRKPSAPIGLPFESVSVEIERGWHSAYIAFGSNMGDRESYIEKALEGLRKNPHIQVEKVSDYYETEPYGGVAEGRFINGAVFVRTLLRPEELLESLHNLEDAAGRERKVRWDSRTLDLDILFYDDIVMDTEELVIPHKDMKNRGFVLEPLCQIAPWHRHPVYGKTVKEMFEELQY